MTDNDIIKLLRSKAEAHCAVCDIKGIVPCEHCVFHYMKLALDLINRQKAEIEMLKEAYAVYEETTGLKQVRADTIHRFAELLKETRGLYGEIWDEDIDNIVRAMIDERSDNK